MSQRERALEILARVGEPDRHWILQQLSSEARARLAEPPASAPPGAAAGSGVPGTAGAAPTQVAVPSTAGDIARLAGADAARMVELLRAEPGWLVSAVLSTHEWPWLKEFLRALPPHTRMDLSRAEHHRISLPPPAIEFVLRRLAAAVEPSMAASAAQSRFEALLARVRRRRAR